MQIHRIYIYILSNKKMGRTFTFEARNDKQAKRRAKVILSEHNPKQEQFELTTLIKNRIKKISLG